jgi:hypothetical protein
VLAGEEPDSYGYGGTGKFSHANKFQSYGVTFGKGDVVMALLDWDTRQLSYCVNGRKYGVASRIKSPAEPLFPHLLSKNVK